MLLNFRLAFRRLRQAPGFAAVAVLTLALGIGANSTVFSALNTLLFRPLPVDRPDQLVFLERVKASFPTYSYPNYVDLRDRNDVLSGLIGYRIAPLSLSVDGRNARAWGYLATGNYFQALGVGALLGRTFTPEDDRTPGSHPVAVLSYGCWQRRFGGDPGVVGRKFKINGLDYTVIGVAPARFYGTEIVFLPELWVPMMMEPQIEPDNPWLDNRETENVMVLGRLKPGVTRPQAEARLNVIARELAREHPSANEGLSIRLVPPGLAGNMLRGPLVGLAAILLAVAALVLLLACTNLAGLLLARAADRRREVAIRLALGAGRRQLIGQMLAESLTLSLAGGAAGLLLAAWLADLFAAWRPPIDVPVNLELIMDARVLAFTAGISLVTCLLFGLAPALQATRVELVPALKYDAVFGRRWQLRDFVVAAQVALSVLLLAGSLLVVRGFRQALRMNIGFNPKNAVSVSFDLALQGYDEPRGREFQRRVLERVSALPGVESAALISALPIGPNRSYHGVNIEGKPTERGANTPLAIHYRVSPGYFRTMQTRLLAGRDFTERDRAGNPRVAIVNESFAKLLLPGENPIGKRFRFGAAGSWTEIVGIAEDGKYTSLSEGPTRVVFSPVLQRYDADTTVVLRSHLPAEQALAALRRAVLELDPVIAIYGAGSLEEHLRFPLFPARLAASVLSVFGAIAMALAAIGVYGITAYAVSRRAREIGIRIAIGASRGRVLRLVLRRTGALLAAGAALGGAAAFGLGGFLSGLTYGVSPRDPATFALAILLMALATFAACWIPARRAMTIDPAATLREE